MTLNLDKSAWKRVRLGDVIRRSREQVDPLTGSVERYVAGGHIDGDGLLIERWGDVDDGQMGSTFRYVFRSGQVLFVSARPYLRKVGIPQFSGVVADKTYVLDAVPENGLSQEFLPFVLSSERFIEFAIAEATGSINPRLLWGPMQRYEFDLPPFDEQKHLADLLWAVERGRRAASQLEHILSRALAVQADVFLGEVEESSGLTLLADLLRESMTDGIREKGPDIEGGVPYIRVSDMTAPRLDVNGMLRTSATLSAANRSSEMRSGDLVIALRSKIGLCHVIPAELDGCNIAQGVGKIAPDRAQTTVEYLYEVLMAPRTQSALDRIAKGTTIREVGLKALRSFRIPIPESLAEQHVIVEKLAKIRSACAAAYEEASATASLADGLSREVFGGAS